MKRIVITALASSLLASCGLYKQYERPGLPEVEGLYERSGTTEQDSLGMASLGWPKVFTDPKLQSLIEMGLHNNTNLRVARLRVEQAEATLSASKLSFLPSLAIAPQINLNSVGAKAHNELYSLPLVASWQADIFASLRNAKKRSAALVEASLAYRQAVESSLVAGIARTYYTLVLLDEQLRVSEATVGLWQENVRTMQALMQAGAFNDAGVSSAEANLASVEASVLTLRQQIRETENALGSLLATSQPEILRNGFAEWRAIAGLELGYPIQLLSRRPDVRRAEQTLAAAFYSVNEARAAFYPKINITGTLLSAGALKSFFVEPVLNLVGSLTQPIFQQGKLSAGLKIARSQYEEQRLALAQSIIDAGIEVNNALTKVQTYRSLHEVYAKRTSAVRRSEKATRLLQETGNSSYLEVLTAQQNLLNAQLQELSNKYNEIAATIALYQALGGGY